MADEMFRPPINRAVRTLDRSFFRKTVLLTAARIFDNKNISKCRSELERSKDALQQDRLGSVHSDPDEGRANTGKKCILLRPESTTDGSPWPHSPTVSELVRQDLVTVIPYELKLEYNYWTYHDIMSAILPEDDQNEIPVGFSQVGHVAHLNLRDQYLQYKHLIAVVLMDKNPGVKTVINKIDDVGEESEYRTFKYEVLAGPDDLNVTISEENCAFKFDYAKVYWNSRLNTEHRRLVGMFKQGEAVCDVMAGIGPFAVPAGKRKAFVWANDLNPDGYISLQDAIKRNKVQDFVRPFNTNGHDFIKDATKRLAETHYSVDMTPKPHRNAPKASEFAPKPTQVLQQPKVFSHYVMNLPASAIAFLPSFIGLYQPDLRYLLPQNPDSSPAFNMPIVHVYCFSTKSDDNVAESIDICQRISEQLGYELKPGDGKDEVNIYDVRDVAPKKRMFCASFRLPEAVAFRELSAGKSTDVSKP